MARRQHGVPFFYAFVKKALQTAGLVPTHRPRGRHRRRREPRACFGELLYLDGSRHRWLPTRPEQGFTLLAVVDDATKQLLHAELWDSGESVPAVMTALRAVVQRYGVPLALYTDRAHWAVHTPTAGSAPDRRRLTQVGRALARLGIEHILGFSPQARGRSERVDAVLEDHEIDQAAARRMGVHTGLYVPLLVHGRAIGVVIAHDKEGPSPRFTDEDLRLAESLSSRAGTAAGIASGAGRCTSAQATAL